MLRIAALAAAVLLALTTLSASVNAKRRCPRGFNACLMHQTELGTSLAKATKKCSRTCSGQSGNASKNGGLHARTGKKCAKGYSACVKHKTRLGTSPGKAARICRRVCAR